MPQGVQKLVLEQAAKVSRPLRILLLKNPKMNSKVQINSLIVLFLGSEEE
jgi:hypothetical protein